MDLYSRVKLRNSSSTTVNSSPDSSPEWKKLKSIKEIYATTPRLTFEYHETGERTVRVVAADEGKRMDEEAVARRKDGRGRKKEANNVSYEFEIGDLVWGKITSHPWWPGVVYDAAFATEEAMMMKKEGYMAVFLYGDSTHGWVKPSKMLPFEEHFAAKAGKTDNKWNLKGVELALEEVKRRSILGFVCRCNLSSSLQKSAYVEQNLFRVEFGGFIDGGLYSEKQMEKAREDVQTKEMLSFLQQLAANARNGGPESADRVSMARNTSQLRYYRNYVRRHRDGLDDQDEQGEYSLAFPRAQAQAPEQASMDFVWGSALKLKTRVRDAQEGEQAGEPSTRFVWGNSPLPKGRRQRRKPRKLKAPTPQIKAEPILSTELQLAAIDAYTNDLQFSPIGSSSSSDTEPTEVSALIGGSTSDMQVSVTEPEAVAEEPQVDALIDGFSSDMDISECSEPEAVAEEPRVDALIDDSTSDMDISVCSEPEAVAEEPPQVAASIGGSTNDMQVSVTEPETVAEEPPVKVAEEPPREELERRVAQSVNSQAQASTSRSDPDRRQQVLQDLLDISECSEPEAVAEEPRVDALIDDSTSDMDISVCSEPEAVAEEPPQVAASIGGSTNDMQVSVTEPETVAEEPPVKVAEEPPREELERRVAQSVNSQAQASTSRSDPDRRQQVLQDLLDISECSEPEAVAEEPRVDALIDDSTSDMDISVCSEPEAVAEEPPQVAASIGGSTNDMQVSVTEPETVAEEPPVKVAEEPPREELERRVAQSVNSQAQASTSRSDPDRRQQVLQDLLDISECSEPEAVAEEPRVDALIDDSTSDMDISVCSEPEAVAEEPPQVAASIGGSTNDMQVSVTEPETVAEEPPVKVAEEPPREELERRVAQSVNSQAQASTSRSDPDRRQQVLQDLLNRCEQIREKIKNLGT